jgi:hypothetical protein
MALIAVTSLLLPLTSGVNWLSRSLWIASMLSAFVSVAFSCKHQRFIGNLLLADKRDLWEFKKFLHDGKKKDPAKPKLKVVLLLSGTRTFFEHSLMLYTIGLGVYLGCLSQGGPTSKEAGPGQTDNRNTFIWFFVFAFFYCFVYLLMDFITNTRHLHGWTCHLQWYDKYKVPPCLEGCNSRICSPGDEEDAELPLEQGEKLPSKLPRLLGVLLSWCPQTSRCKGTCQRDRPASAQSQQQQKTRPDEIWPKDPETVEYITAPRDTVLLTETTSLTSPAEVVEAET